jgi:hypothetical protein
MATVRDLISDFADARLARESVSSEPDAPAARKEEVRAAEDAAEAVLVEALSEYGPVRVGDMVLLGALPVRTERVVILTTRPAATLPWPPGETAPPPPAEKLAGFLSDKKEV